jgi:hypothetical protein
MIRAIAITSTTLLVAVVGLMVWGWTQDNEIPPRSIYSIKLDCPVGTTQYTDIGNGGEWIGWYRTCVQNHGPIYVWRDEKLVFKGTFVNGKREGDFVEFDEEERILRTTKYVDGRAVQE